ncbi:MAG: inorganic diphosphatase [Gammaproteobacteria bacterium]|nr:inorganic diphosphatase [Gammaproteobacteria bacterium]
MRIDAIAIGQNPPDDVNVIIEVPVGGQPIKYELDKDAGTLVVDRFLYTPMSYPGNYGFVPHTLSEDGDPIDVLVVNTRELVPACVINVRPVGVLIMEDNAGQDEKIIAVPSHTLTKRYDHVLEYSDLPEITLQQVEHFFEHYKDLEPGKWVKIGDWHGADDAKQLIVEAIERASQERLPSRDTIAAGCRSYRLSKKASWRARSSALGKRPCAAPKLSST